MTDIEHAYQALALDERRNAFRPTLWYIPHDLVKDPNLPTPELKQVWVRIRELRLQGLPADLLQFPGVHINSGGGSDDCLSEMKGDFESKCVIFVMYF
jgi:hypothetical protein